MDGVVLIELRLLQAVAKLEGGFDLGGFCRTDAVLVAQLIKGGAVQAGDITEGF